MAAAGRSREEEASVKCDPEILFVRERFPWMGSHSGYDLLCAKVHDISDVRLAEIEKTARRASFVAGALCGLLRRGMPRSLTYDYASLVTEFAVIRRKLRTPDGVTHLLYLERMFGLLGWMPKKLVGNLVGTVHQPVSLWLAGRHDPAMVGSLDALIVLSREKQRYFETVLPGRVHFIRHGVDTGFFTPVALPDGECADGRPRCVFSGVWLRDLATLGVVVEKVRAANPGIRFDLLVPRDRRTEDVFARLAGFEQVSWHCDLTDEQLRDLYRRAALLLLPLQDCTANNALLEGVACGLPIVSNSVGGVPDYTSPDFAALFPLGDVDGMSAAVLALADDRCAQREKGLKARAFAENCLDWNRIARETLDVYRQLL